MGNFVDTHVHIHWAPHNFVANSNGSRAAPKSLNVEVTLFGGVVVVVVGVASSYFSSS